MSPFLSYTHSSSQSSICTRVPVARKGLLQSTRGSSSQGLRLQIVLRIFSLYRRCDTDRIVGGGSRSKETPVGMPRIAPLRYPHGILARSTKAVCSTNQSRPFQQCQWLPRAVWVSGWGNCEVGRVSLPRMEGDGAAPPIGQPTWFVDRKRDCSSRERENCWASTLIALEVDCNDRSSQRLTMSFYRINRSDITLIWIGCFCVGNQ